MRRKIRMNGAALVAGRSVRRGDVVVGYEHDLKPLVDCGSAEWADVPEESPASRRTPAKKASSKKRNVKNG